LKLAPEDLKLGNEAPETTLKRLSEPGALASYWVLHLRRMAVWLVRSKEPTNLA
jgi:hypothetical protein